MDIIKNLTYIIFPLHSDIKRDAENEIVNDKNMASVWTKRGIASGFTLLSIALTALAALAFTGILPVGIVGFYALAGAAGVAVVATILYLLGLAGGRLRSNAIFEKDNENFVQSIRDSLNKKEEVRRQEKLRQEEHDKQRPPMYFEYGTPQVGPKYAT